MMLFPLSGRDVDGCDLQPSRIRIDDERQQSAQNQDQRDRENESPSVAHGGVFSNKFQARPHLVREVNGAIILHEHGVTYAHTVCRFTPFLRPGYEQGAGSRVR